MSDLQLAMIVTFSVVVVTVLIGAIGYMIDRSARRHERSVDRERWNF